MSAPFRFAICNEAFGREDFAGACRVVRQTGYSGIEIAPFTLAEDPSRLSPSERVRYRHAMESEGLAFAGLHWLLAGPPGLHATTADPAVRTRTWDYIRSMVDLCADLGPGGVIVFGSPQQRAATGEVAPAEAKRRLIEGLAATAPYAEARGVTILLEPLPLSQCNVVTTLAEAAAVVEEINQPGLRTMFDTHNAVDETEPHPALVEKFLPFIRHVHVNELDGRHPGTGDYPFAPLLQTLTRLGYTGWVSVEAFDFTPGAPRIAAESLACLKEQISNK